ncbi:putative endoplasmic reticulum vesicle protein 25 [Glarea lozoyensis 74030]|uniref:Putative endoplasmic reticulum vesicle protein 25 n=1 Tax=Glarea lozoyensis (strain ATCC 74030 / MF5533) TaxID=1104152 RepID=H0EZ51_GLAL7|nr:putative endoplasmic reticulum vesicle protein 25 [Glarea lozoyensis 74030]
MVYTQSLLRTACSFFFLLACAEALKFDIEAKSAGDKSRIKDAVGNEYGKPKDVVGEQRMAFTSHADSSFDVCFENHFTGGKGVANPFRHVELDIDIGADAKDWSAVQATEKLKPVETELRRIEEMVQEIVAEMDYLRSREQKLRDTNESTNNRVKWFAFSTMGDLPEGVFQIKASYLNRFLDTAVGVI